VSGIVLIDGKPRTQIDVRDRGLQYGDGLFETMAVLDGEVRRLDAHLARLQSGCERLGIVMPERTLLTAEIAAVTLNAQRAVLKLMVTRGFGGRGYRLPDQPAPTRILWLDAWPEYPAEWAHTGVNVRVCSTVLGVQPQLAGIKHLNRLEQILARREWQGSDDVAEGLMMDTRGAVICGTMTNVFVVHSGNLLTPRLDRCGVAGTVRAAILQAAAELGIPGKEVAIDFDALREADEVFLTNALIGVWPVRRLGDHSYRVGPVTRQLQAVVASSSTVTHI
jgi:4-amino-4-deoxychorismate lyase